MARKGVGIAIGAAVFGLLATAAPPASAQVLSIGDDGAVTTYSGPQVFTNAGATPISPPVSTASAATPAEVSAAIQESAQRHVAAHI